MSAAPEHAAGVQPETDLAVDFLHQWCPEGPWVLTAIQPDRKAIETRTITDIREVRRFIDHYTGRRNIYFQVNPVTKVVKNVPEREEIAALAWLHIDIDPRAGEDLANEQIRALRRLTTDLPKGVPPPSCIIFSGGGYQGFWKLQEPVPIDGDVAKAEDAKLYNLQLETLFGADSCHNVNRIMRVPGTVNLPDVKKKKKGREPVLATLHSFEDRAYPIEQFSKAPAVQTPGETSFCEHSPGGEISGEVNRILDLAELDEWSVPDRVKVVISEGHDPDEPLKGDTSRSGWLYYAVCALVRHGVPEQIIFAIIMDPDWGISESVLELKSGAPRYAKRQIQQAKRAVQADPPLLHKDEPLRSARLFRDRERPTLMRHNDDWLAHDGAAYRELEEATIKSELYRFLDRAMAPGVGDKPPTPFNPTKPKVANVEEALQALAHVERDVHAPPCWIEGDGPPPAELLACRNGLLHLPTGKLLAPTPRFFTRNALSFDYDPEAPPPERWLAFLHELWGDGDEIAVLQEVTGYLLVPDTSLQKIFLLVGPRRSGKGTIGRVLRRLVGEHNTTGPTLSTLERDFSLAALIGRQLAIVSDMRLGKRTDRAAITENLLRISGEDVLTIDRKYKHAWTGQMAVRFVILTNQLPNLPDDSGALASRLVPLVMHSSFLGREDQGLQNDLFAELPGILRWAMEGWRRLRDRGHFVLPESSKDAIDDVHTMGSPVAAFLRDACVLDPSASTPTDDVWRAWKHWCEERQMLSGDIRHFGARLSAAGNGRVRKSRRQINGERMNTYVGLALRGHQDEIPF